MSWPGGSSDSGVSARMVLSSTGERFTAPPQTRHAPASSTIRSTSSFENATSQNTSIVSAVPVAKVTAREEVFGTVSPAAATSGANTGVTRLPATPPMECLSATTSRSHEITSPAVVMRSVRCIVSASESPLVYTAATYAPSSTSASRSSVTSRTIRSNSSPSSSMSSSFLWMYRTDAGVGASETSTGPVTSASRRVVPTTPGETSSSVSSTMATVVPSSVAR